MCYYNGIRVSRSEFIRLLEIEKDLKQYQLNRPMQSGFDYPDWPIIKPIDGCKDYDITFAHWEFIPPTVQSMKDLEMIRQGIDPRTGMRKAPIPWLNATGENILNSNMFREAALTRRCLVLSTGFYEWRHVTGVNKRTGEPLKTSVKYPYHIYLKDQEVFFMAGIWQAWTDRSTGETIDTFALVTTQANALMEQVHNSKKRMPTILTEQLAGEWISDSLPEKRITEIATYQISADRMTAHTVRKDFREYIDPQEKFEYQDLPALVF